MGKLYFSKPLSDVLSIESKQKLVTRQKKILSKVKNKIKVELKLNIIAKKFNFSQ